MDEIERKLRMFYVLEPEDRWEHLLIVADECEEKGDTELAEALRWCESIKLFPDIDVEPQGFLFVKKNTYDVASTVAHFCKHCYGDKRLNDMLNRKRPGGVIFTSTDQ